MSPSEIAAYLERQLQEVASSTGREQRIQALMQYFQGSLAACAEKVIDGEMASINGSPQDSRYQDRPDSAYYPYNLAKRNGYAGFTDEQRQVLRGLVQHTAFELLLGIFCRLADMSEHQVSIRLQPKVSPDLHHDLCERSPDHGNYYWSEDLPAALSKYES